MLSRFAKFCARGGLRASSRPAVAAAWSRLRRFCVPKTKVAGPGPWLPEIARRKQLRMETSALITTFLSGQPIPPPPPRSARLSIVAPVGVTGWAFGCLRFGFSEDFAASQIRIVVDGSSGPAWNSVVEVAHRDAPGLVAACHTARADMVRKPVIEPRSPPVLFKVRGPGSYWSGPVAKVSVAVRGRNWVNLTALGKDAEAYVRVRLDEADLSKLILHFQYLCEGVGIVSSS